MSNRNGSPECVRALDAPSTAALLTPPISILLKLKVGAMTDTSNEVMLEATLTFGQQALESRDDPIRRCNQQLDDAFHAGELFGHESVVCSI